MKAMRQERKSIRGKRGFEIDWTGRSTRNAASIGVNNK